MTSFIPQRAADLFFEYRQAIDLSVSWLSESEDIHRRMKVLCSEGRIPGTIQVGLF